MLLMMSVLAMFAASALAQKTGSINGTVTGPSGAVSGAKVTITNKVTGQVRSVLTTSAGAYTSGALLTGNYTVQIEAAGFATSQVSVAVQADAKAVSDFTLKVSGVPVNPGQVTVQGVRTTEEIEDLPINGRNFLELAQLEPGVQTQEGSTFDPTKNGFSSLSFGGRFGRSARVEVDGVDVSDETVGTTTLNVPASAIQEFRLSQSSLDLSTDLTSSGAVNIVTRSGTNDLHGELFGYYRNGDASASLPGGDLTSLSTPGSKPSWERQQFGGNLGGALIKDKLFWFVDAERNRQDLQDPVLAAGPFFPRSTRIREPFREVETTNRLDYQLSETARAFYRFSYDQNSEVRPFGSGPSMQPFLSRTNTPAHAIGVDFTTGSFTHAIRFEYLNFRNSIVDSSADVLGIGNPLPNTTIDIGGGATFQCASGSLFCSGPNYLAPQQTYQSDHQYKYDGSHIWRSHLVRYEVNFNHILGGGYASFFSISPTLADGGSAVLPAGVLGSTGDATDPLNYPVEWSFIGNGQGFTTETTQFGLPGGGRHDNRLGAYIGDTWKVKPNLAVTYGVRWVRNQGRTDSDLAAIPQLNAWGSGLGNKVRQPNANFGPQLGVAWDPNSSGKTSIRGGIGIYYDNAIFNNVFFDRPLRLPKGLFLSTPAVCVGGAAGEIQWPSGAAPPPAAAGAVVNPNGTVSPTWCGESIGMAAPQAVALESAYQIATAAAGASSNPSFIGNAGAFAGPNQNGLSLLAPNYQTPRSVQMNVGLQHEFRPGLIFTADYLRNVGTRTLLGVDVNHGGDAGTFNLANAVNDRDFAQTTNGCFPGAGQVGCMFAKLGSAGTLAAYGQAGIGGPAQVTGGAPCPTCAFPGINPNLGVNVMNFPEGRSVYHGFDLSLKQQMTNFLVRGVKHADFQISYSRSSYVSQTQDSDFVNQASDFIHPDRFTGPNALDRKHQFSLAGSFDLPALLRLSLIGHFYSPLPATLTFQQNAGAAEVLVTDWTGDGTTGDIIPGSSVGSYMRSISPSGLSNFIQKYNASSAGVATPAGNALVTGGVFSLQDLQNMGGVLQPLAGTVQNPAGLSWLKTLDLKISWVYKFRDRITIEPSVGVFNALNFANFDVPGNTQSGALNFGAGSLSSFATLLQPQNTVGGTSVSATDPVTGRTNRASLQSGTNALGAPRAFEWGLKISF